MVFIVILVVIFITLVILVQAGVMPWFIRIEGQRLSTQVDALATQLRKQLDRVEAQQRSMTESVVTLKSFALDKSAPGDTDPGEEVSISRRFSIHWSKRSASVLAVVPGWWMTPGASPVMPPVRRRLNLLTMPAGRRVTAYPFSQRQRRTYAGGDAHC
ncbi:hypothetical protein [Enterobacter sp. BIDMC 26]|jgi:ABC-type multidrug transport system fused ATPase/permease subunit|uniref:hypothetical protein n=1 Tax=Enterobacter sp. BIDMC 26 TaxID=1329838 RepID=UPI00044EB89D|nr:hypothetical protein [Enterobacter sp. BIDMC 26]EUM24212.1 hypothetical protein L462_04297 [Enterobacter sp. BIDMC 26]